MSASKRTASSNEHKKEIEKSLRLTLTPEVNKDNIQSSSLDSPLNVKKIKIEDMETIDENDDLAVELERLKKKLVDNEESNAKCANKSSLGKSNARVKSKRIDITILRLASGGSSLVAGMIFANAWHLKDFLKGEEEIGEK
jgi:regulator of replication initiation timing